MDWGQMGKTGMQVTKVADGRTWDPCNGGRQRDKVDRLAAMGKMPV